MAKIFAFGALLVGGLIVADILTHPAGTTAAGNSAVAFQKTAGNQLLGIAA